MTALEHFVLDRQKDGRAHKVTPLAPVGAKNQLSDNNVPDLVRFEAAGLHLLLGEERLPRLLHGQECQTLTLCQECQRVSEPLRGSGAR